MNTNESRYKITKMGIALMALALMTFEPVALQSTPTEATLFHCKACETPFTPKNHAKQLETFLSQEVPGLPSTYRDVIDAMINKGFEVYIQGGMIRDLLGEDSLQPHDVDLFYVGKRSDLKRLLDDKKWMYTTLPGKSLISIGDQNGVFIDTTPVSMGLHADVNTMEYTLNNIVYHCNTQTFMPGAEVGFDDLQHRRLRVLTDNWNQWLHEENGTNYKKIFRFWKMVGKGFVYSQEFEDFIVQETLAVKDTDEDFFNCKLLKYLTKNAESFDDIANGCSSVMGVKWSEENIIARREVVEESEETLTKARQKHTYFANMHTGYEGDEEPSKKTSSLKLAVRNMFMFFK